MFEITRSKKLPYASDFIQYGLDAAKKERLTIWNKTGCAFGTVLSLAIPAAAFINAQGWDIGRAFIWLILSPALVSAGMAIVDKAFMSPKNKKNRPLIRRLEILEPYRIALEQRRLHKDLDGTVAKLIEASAFHWSNIHQELNKGMWNEPDLNESLVETKRDALRAADITMYETLILSQRCFAPAGHKKSSAEDLVEDLKDLNLEAVLDGFKQVLKGENVYRSNEAVNVVPKVTELTTKLKSLSHHIWTITNVKKNEVLPTVQTEAPGASIDHVLRQFSEADVARRELDGNAEDRIYH